MIIKKLHASEIINSLGIPTLQCTITLANNQKVCSSIPSGFKQQERAAIYSYDFFNKGMKQAAEYINTSIAPLFENKSINALAMDSELIDLDTSQKKNTIGANTTLVVSIALFKAQATSEHIQPFELLQSISGTKEIKMPIPITSIILGRTPTTQQNILEFLLIPQENTIEKNIESVLLFQHNAKKQLELQNQPITISKYGSFVPNYTSIEENFIFIQDVFKSLPNQSYQIGLNILASDIYDPETKTYQWNDKVITSQQLIEEYEHIIKTYPYVSYIQSGMADNDKEGWKLLTTSLSNNNIAGDTVFCTNPMLIRKGILDNIANIIIIRPEYIGTISQTIAAIDACKKNNRPFIIASDLGETNEDFTTDLAIGTNAKYLKAGAIYSGQYIAKYNRALTIQES